MEEDRKMMDILVAFIEEMRSGKKVRVCMEKEVIKFSFTYHAHKNFYILAYVGCLCFRGVGY